MELTEYNMDEDKLFWSAVPNSPYGLGILYNRTTQLAVSVP